MTATAETGIAGAFELSITRTFAAPPALVYRLWAEREHMLRWWGPKQFTCTSLEMDFRPGGSWRAHCAACRAACDQVTVSPLPASR